MMEIAEIFLSQLLEAPCDSAVGPRGDEGRLGSILNFKKQLNHWSVFATFSLFPPRVLD